MSLKTFTIADIRSWNPCYDPGLHLPEDWQGTALDILRRHDIPPQDRMWVVCRNGIIDDKTLRLFAVWCARQVEHLMTDDRSKAALDIAERFAHGHATGNELAAARTSARAAARAAARDAAWDAAWDATRDANRAAAWAAACSVAAAAAWDATRAAAWAATRDATRDATRAAAWAAARAAQIKKLIEMLETK